MLGGRFTRLRWRQVRESAARTTTVTINSTRDGEDGGVESHDSQDHGEYGGDDQQPGDHLEGLARGRSDARRI